MWRCCMLYRSWRRWFLSWSGTCGVKVFWSVIFLSRCWSFSTSISTIVSRLLTSWRRWEKLQFPSTSTIFWMNTSSGSTSSLLSCRSRSQLDLFFTTWREYFKELSLVIFVDIFVTGWRGSWIFLPFWVLFLRWLWIQTATRTIKMYAGCASWFVSIRALKILITVLWLTSCLDWSCLIWSGSWIPSITVSSWM